MLAFYSNDLVELGTIYRTDKVDEIHTYKGLNYLDIYEKYFREFKRKPINLLEIGVLNGNSLRAWKRYFPKARIFGLDIDPDTKQYEEDRIFIEIGSQADESVLSKLSGRVNHFDIIIDDGSHVNKYIIKSFEYLFKRLKSGGIYIIEDLAMSYEKLEEMNFSNGKKGIRENWSWAKHSSPDESFNNDRRDMDKLFEKIIYDLDHKQGDILSIHFWSFLAVIIKA